MKKIEWSVSLGVLLFLLIVSIFYYQSYIYPAVTDWHFVHKRSLELCISNKYTTLSVCKNYADWVVSQSVTSYLAQCIQDFDNTQIKVYPTAYLCLNRYKLNYNHWLEESGGCPQKGMC
jgi:hypothetical protein